MSIKKYKWPQFVNRMGDLFRWSLMRNTRKENLKEHSFDVATTTHLLVVIFNKIYGPTIENFQPLDAGMAVIYSMYHDTAEVFTGDFPTPLKEFGGGVLKRLADELEAIAVNKMVTSLPEELRGEMGRVFDIPKQYKGIIKAADQISALNKCRAEIAAGNNEFKPAATRLEEILNACNLPEVAYFMEHFMTERPMTLEELIEGNGASLLD